MKEFIYSFLGMAIGVFVANLVYDVAPGTRIERLRKRVDHLEARFEGLVKSNIKLVEGLIEERKSQ